MKCNPAAFSILVFLPPCLSVCLLLCSQPNRPRFNGPPPDGYCNYGNPMYGGRPPGPRPPGPPHPPMPRQMRPPRPNFQPPRMPPQPHMYPPHPLEPPPRPMEQPRRNTPSPPPILDRRCVEIDSFLDDPKIGQKRALDGLARRFDRHGNQIKYKYLQEKTKCNGPVCLYCGTSFTEKKVSSIVLVNLSLV